MKYLGIDYGTKRVGVAVSDEGGSVAMPREVLENGANLVERLSRIAKEVGAGAVVIGESKDYKGKENPVMKEISEFREKLGKALDLPVLLEPEFMTSMQAERLQGKNELHDASAAALILQSYLDKKNFENDEDIGE